MKAQLKPRIDLEGRTPLETAIPLAPPFVVFVDPASMDKGGESFLNKQLAGPMLLARFKSMVSIALGTAAPGGRNPGIPAVAAE
jgi:hypothetical protein